MDQNPYSPTRAPLGDEQPPGSPLKAVFVGFVVDLGGTIAASIVIGIAYALFAAVPDTIEGVEQSLQWPEWLTTLASGVGLGFSILGGYTCARIVRRNEYRWGGVLGACVFVAGLLLGTAETAPEEELFLGAVSIAGTLFGAHLGRSRPTAPTA